jgi:hypothetical protein
VAVLALLPVSRRRTWSLTWAVVVTRIRLGAPVSLAELLAGDCS